MSTTRTQQKAVNKYIKRNYDRINVIIKPKGKKFIIEKHAKTQDESVNTFINRAIDETMKCDRKEYFNIKRLRNRTEKEAINNFEFEEMKKRFEEKYGITFKNSENISNYIDRIIKEAINSYEINREKKSIEESKEFWEKKGEEIKLEKWKN